MSHLDPVLTAWLCSQKWHPDKCKEENAKEKFQEISAAYAGAAAFPLPGRRNSPKLTAL